MNEKLKMIFSGVMGSVYVPDSIKDINEKKLLHISDTPTIFFGALKKLLSEVSPNIIIHTGDMVDNIKLGLCKEQLPRYDHNLKIIMNILESSGAEKIYICEGNHDNIDIMHKYAGRSTIIQGLSNIEIFNVKSALSHYPYKIIQDPADYNFFGHDISLGNGIIDDKIYLNGISTINILTENSKKLFHLKYPHSIDEARLMKRKIGL